MDGVGFVDALTGYLARIKSLMLKQIQQGEVKAGEQLELFEQQGVLL